MYNFARQLVSLTTAESADVRPRVSGHTPKDESDNVVPSLTKTRVPILVDDSHQLIHISDPNAARYVMRQRKFFSSKRCWTALSPAENVVVEDLVGECLKHGTTPSARTTIEKRISAHKPIQSFLVDPEAITLGDIAVFFTLNGSNGPAASLSPTLKEWLQFCAHHFDSVSPSVENRSLLKAEKAPASGANLKTDTQPSGKNELRSAPPTNFIRQIIEDDIKAKKHDFIVTRFPPEPNGFLHLGHAKSICLNFGLAKAFNGRCHLRFDDTNPTKEDMRYITAIQEDVRWLGGDWGDHLYYASDYFQQLYDLAVDLIKKGYAYVDDQTENEVRKNRGDVNTPGVDSPYRNRSPEENLRLFEAMRAGQCPEGSRILRAKIDMKSGNMNLRDPPIYRVRFASHPRTQNTWCIYPIYDFAHGQSDSIEHITHSICTLEFEDHRPLYEWFQEKLNIFRTRQIEFARLNCTYLVMSKRKLITLVENKHVNDWDDPRLPTISGMRRKGYPAAAIRDFCERIGVAKRDTTIPLEYLETCVS